MRISIRAKGLLDAASTTSKPVWAFLIGEAITVIGIVAAGAVLATGTVDEFPLDRLPPWRALMVLFLVSAGAELVRAAHPLVTARRWHGVLVRRIDERWGEER